jgi:hypothetical protein
MWDDHWFDDYSPVPVTAVPVTVNYSPVPVTAVVEPLRVGGAFLTAGILLLMVVANKWNHLGGQ